MIPSQRFFLVFAASFAMTFAVGCSQRTEEQPAGQAAQLPDTRAADEAAIRADSAAWSRAAQAKDLEKAVSFYADDALQFPDKAPLAKGKDDIRKNWQQLFAVSGPGLSFSTTGVEVARSGDLAYEYGAYDVVTAKKKAKPRDEKGKYVVVWKKQADGSWKAVADIDNPDR